LFFCEKISLHRLVGSEIFIKCDKELFITDETNVENFTINAPIMVKQTIIDGNLIIV